MTQLEVIKTWPREQLESAFTQRERQLEVALKVRDKLKAQIARLRLVHIDEIGAFQNEVRDLVIKCSGAPDYTIDGAGSDNSWQEFTLAEIGQGFSYMDNKIAKIEAALNNTQAIINSLKL